MQPINTGVFGQKGVTPVTSLIVKCLGCYKPVTWVLHFAAFLCPDGFDQFFGFAGQRAVERLKAEG
jgi:hypothetical protein